MEVQNVIGGAVNAIVTRRAREDAAVVVVPRVGIEIACRLNGAAQGVLRAQKEFEGAGGRPGSRTGGQILKDELDARVVDFDVTTRNGAPDDGVRAIGQGAAPFEHWTAIGAVGIGNEDVLLVFAGAVVTPCRLVVVAGLRVIAAWIGAASVALCGFRIVVARRHVHAAQTGVVASPIVATGRLVKVAGPCIRATREDALRQRSEVAGRLVVTQRDTVARVHQRHDSFEDHIGFGGGIRIQSRQRQRAIAEQ